MSTMFWGAAAAAVGAFDPVTHDFTTAASSSVSVPTGATQLIIEVWGAGGGGMGWSSDGYDDSQGGGGGGYSKRTVALSGDAGKSITYTVGAGGAKGTNTLGIGGDGATGGNSTCAGATLTNSFSMAGNGGVGGGATAVYTWTKGQGGTATGGDTNTTGNSSSTTYGLSAGGAARVGDDSLSAGKGGNGWEYGFYTGPDNGNVGRVRLRFT